MACSLVAMAKFTAESVAKYLQDLPSALDEYFAEGSVGMSDNDSEDDNGTVQ